MERLKKYLLLLFMAATCCGTAGCANLEIGRVAGITGEFFQDPYVSGGDAEKAVSENDQYYGEYLYQDELEKYDIGGTDAFYILPAGVVLRKCLLQFELIDIRADNTVIYAYQTLYSEYGVKNNKLLFEPTAATQMQTVLMSYKPGTKETSGKPDYKVFFERKDKVKVEYVKAEGSDAGETLGQVLSVSMVDEEGNQTEEQMERNACYAQKLPNQELYMFYYQDQMYFYDADGNCKAENDLSGVLSLTAQSYGGEGAQYTISKVQADDRLFAYIVMQIEKQGQKINEDTEEKDLEGEESGVIQLLLPVFFIDVSGNNLVSENINYKKQVEEWKKDDGKTYTFDDWTGANEPEWSDTGVITPEAVIEQSANTFGGYRMQLGESESLGLFYTKQGWNNRWIYRRYEVWANQAYQVLPTESPNRDFRFSTEWYLDAYIRRDAVLRFALLEQTEDQQNVNSVSKILLPRGVSLGEEKAIWQEEEKTITIKWTRKIESQEDEQTDGGEKPEPKVTYEEYEKTVTLSGKFLSRYEATLKAPGGAKSIKAEWGQPRILAGDIVGGVADHGIVKYYTSEEKTMVTYQQGKRWTFQAVSGKAGSAFAVDEINGNVTGNVLCVETSESMLFMPKSTVIGEGEDMFQVANADVQFSANPRAGETDELMKNVSGNKSDVKATMTEKDTSDAYVPQGVRIVNSGGKKWLYLAGVNNGIVRYNIDKERAAQLSPYPSYAFRMEGNTCYVIGFPTNEYQYDNGDMAFAKFFAVPVADDEANINLVMSALERNPSLYETIAKEGAAGKATGWNTLLESLGVSTGESETTSSVNALRTKIIKGERDKREAIQSFCRIASGVTSNDPVKVPDEITGKLEACYYGTDVEKLLLEYKGVTVEDVSIGDVSGNDKIDEAERAKAVDQMQKGFEAQQKRDEILMEIKEKAGYGRGQDAEWTKKLDEIAKAMHPNVLEGERNGRKKK